MKSNVDNFTAKKISVADEFEEVLRHDDLVAYMDENILNIKHRLTPMVIGLFADADYKTVNTWLHRMGEEQLSPRNVFEAMFIYAYSKYSDLSGSEKAQQWRKLFETYRKSIEDNLKEREISSIKTFGDLCSSLEGDSNGLDDRRTFATNNYTKQEIVPKLEQAIDSDDPNVFEKYLAFLLADESIKSYERKATYYLRRFLYEIIMDGIYLIYDRHQYSETTEENIKTKRAAFSSDESFNRFIEYNCICLDNIKNPKGRHSANTMRSALGFERKTNTVTLGYDECKKWMWDKKISYSSLRFSFYELFGNINETPIEYFILKQYIWEENGTYNIGRMEFADYNVVRDAFMSEKNNMPALRKDEIYSPDEDTTGTKEFLISKYMDFKKKDNRNTYNTLLENMISGKINTSRRMLLLFGVFAGYELIELSNIISKCGFEELKKHSTFDNAIVSLINDEYIKTRKELYNSELFLSKSNDFNCDDKEEYKNTIQSIKDDYIYLLAQQLSLIANDTSLPTVSDIFLNDRMKNIMQNQSKQLPKIKIRKK